MQHRFRRVLIGIAALAAGVATGVPAAAQGDPGAALRQRLTQAGYGEGAEAVRNALRSTDPAAQAMALRVAMHARDKEAVGPALELLGSDSVRVRFEAGLLLHSFGDQRGLAVVDDIAGATRQVLLERKDDQPVIVDAVEWFALNGYTGYVYQLSLLLDGAGWSMKVEAARALQAFRQMSDPCQEQAWLIGLEIVGLALAEEQPELDPWAGRLLSTLMQGLREQPEITPAVREKLASLAESRLPAEVGVTARAITDLAAALEERQVRAPQIPCAPLDPDPREVGARAVLALVSFLNRGVYDSFQEDLDIRGEFEGLSREEWIEKQRREYREPKIESALRKNVMPRTVRQPAPGTVVVEAVMDVLNDEARRWDRYDYTFVVEWFGFDWHFALIESSLWPEERQPDRSPPRAEPPAEGPDAELGALAERFIDALAGGKVKTLREILDPEGVYLGNLSRTEFLVQLEQNWAAADPSDFFITPTAYRFSGTPEETVVEVESFNRGLITPAQLNVLYTLRAGRDPESGGLRITSVDIAAERLGE